MQIRTHSFPKSFSNPPENHSYFNTKIGKQDDQSPSLPIKYITMSSTLKPAIKQRTIDESLRPPHSQ